jgi:hypothetical protein
MMIVIFTRAVSRQMREANSKVLEMMLMEMKKLSTLQRSRERREATEWLEGGY